jgi:deoxyribodipyrimidine photo-lyase
MPDRKYALGRNNPENHRYNYQQRLNGLIRLEAPPVFSIFNPVTQGEKFDPAGRYIRRYIPELEHVPDKYIHAPWKAPALSYGYPEPLVDLKLSPEKALEAHAQIK